MSKKLNLRDRVMNGEVDLSLCDLQEVPVRDISLVKKATALDLSNNRLKNLNKNFASLTHLVKLDLSKNQISKLPDNFGDLILLKHLDLYSNHLAHLPLSFGQLVNLRWLDLKNNPLVPALAEVAGPCQDTQQCQACAKKVVKVIGDAKQRLEEEQRKLAQLEKEKEMAEKAAAKKEQQKNKKASKNEKKKAQENGLKHQNDQHQDNNVNQRKKDRSNKANMKAPTKKPSRSLFRTFFKLLFVLLFTSTSVLGFLYLVDFNKYLQVREGAGRLWNATVEMLPGEVVTQGRVAAEYVRPTAELVLVKVQSTLNQTSTFLNTNPIVKDYWANLRDLSAALSVRFVELLRTVYREVPVYCLDLKKRWFE